MVDRARRLVYATEPQQHSHVHRQAKRPWGTHRPAVHAAASVGQRAAKGILVVGKYLGNRSSGMCTVSTLCHFPIGSAVRVTTGELRPPLCALLSGRTVGLF